MDQWLGAAPLGIAADTSAIRVIPGDAAMAEAARRAYEEGYRPDGQGSVRRRDTGALFEGQERMAPYNPLEQEMELLIAQLEDQNEDLLFAKLLQGKTQRPMRLYINREAQEARVRADIQRAREQRLRAEAMRTGAKPLRVERESVRADLGRALQILRYVDQGILEPVNRLIARASVGTWARIMGSGADEASFAGMLMPYYWRWQYRLLLALVSGGGVPPTSTVVEAVREIVGYDRLLFREWATSPSVTDFVTANELAAPAAAAPLYERNPAAWRVAVAVYVLTRDVLARSPVAVPRAEPTLIGARAGDPANAVMQSQSQWLAAILFYHTRRAIECVIPFNNGDGTTGMKSAIDPAKVLPTPAGADPEGTITWDFATVPDKGSADGPVYPYLYWERSRSRAPPSLIEGGNAVSTIALDAFVRPFGVPLSPVGGAGVPAPVAGWEAVDIVTYTTGAATLMQRPADMTLLRDGRVDDAIGVLARLATSLKSTGRLLDTTEPTGPMSSVFPTLRCYDRVCETLDALMGPKVRLLLDTLCPDATRDSVLFGFTLPPIDVIQGASPPTQWGKAGDGTGFATQALEDGNRLHGPYVPSTWQALLHAFLDPVVASGVKTVFPSALPPAVTAHLLPAMGPLWDSRTGGNDFPVWRIDPEVWAFAANDMAADFRAAPVPLAAAGDARINVGLVANVLLYGLGRPLADSMTRYMRRLGGRDRLDTDGNVESGVAPRLLDLADVPDDEGGGRGANDMYSPMPVILGPPSADGADAAQRDAASARVESQRADLVTQWYHSLAHARGYLAATGAGADGRPLTFLAADGELFAAAAAGGGRADPAQLRARVLARMRTRQLRYGRPWATLAYLVDFVRWTWSSDASRGRWQARVAQLRENEAALERRIAQLAADSYDTERPVWRQMQLDYAPSAENAGRPGVSGTLFLMPHMLALLRDGEDFAREHAPASLAERDDLLQLLTAARRHRALSSAFINYLAAREAHDMLNHRNQYETKMAYEHVPARLQAAENAFRTALLRFAMEPPPPPRPSPTSSAGKGPAWFVPLF